MGYGMWDMGCGIWDVIVGYGVWDMEQGTGNRECGMWNLGYGM